MTTTPDAVLRLAEGVPVTPENFLLMNELIQALKDLVAFADKVTP